MYLPQFKEFLLDFNNMTVTEAKCEGVFKHNFIVSGLTDDNFETLSMVFKYHPSRMYGVGCISKKQYDAMTTPMSVVSSNEPPYTESWVVNLWVANLEGDMLDCLSGILTHGKVYDVTVDEYGKYVVLNDRGILKGYHHSWFTPVKLYDEDESELVCRAIEFNKGDWFDLSKHTSEQIRYIAKFYKFHNIDGLLEDDGKWVYVYYTSGEFIGTYSERYTTNLEYHFNDLFYKEGE